jgi:hypothetical protein
MAMGKVTIGISKAVLLAEQYPVRFEAFCCDAISGLEGGRPIFMTSANYDRGRDLRSVGTGTQIIGCCSLTDSIDEKAIADVKKNVAAGTKIEKLYFCSSKPVTEHRGDALKAQIRTLLTPGTEVEVLGNEQLSQYGTREPTVLTKHYAGEVRDAIAALSEDDADTVEEETLRLALCTIGNESAGAIRDAAWTACLRRTLSATPKTLNECCRDASGHLRLSSNLPTDLLREHLDALVDLGHASVGDGAYALTDAGKAASSADQERAAAALLAGRAAFRIQIEETIGYEFTASQFDAIWAALQETLTHQFYARGQDVIRGVRALLGETEGAPVSRTGTGDPVAANEPAEQEVSFIDRLAAAAAATAAFAPQVEEIRTAVADALRERNGAGSEWLLRACAGFVAVCSMGLETKSAKELERIVENTTLVFDTDVVLSFLGAGEPDHDAVVEIHRRWREMGGSILVAEPVLQEVARHAWIAETDFVEVQALLPGTFRDRTHLIRNAFVRGFATLLDRGKAKKRQWQQFIGQFRGKAPYDYSNIKNILWGDHKFGELPKASSKYQTARQEAYDYLMQKGPHRGENDKHHEDKTRRDSELYAAMIEHAENLRLAGSSAACYLLSSAGRLVRVERRLRGTEAGHVIPISAVAYLLSLVPGRSLGLSALRSFLFDGRWHEQMSDFELASLRVVRQTENFDLPWAKRTQLRRELRANLEAMAKDRGAKRVSQRDVDKIGGELLSPANAATAAGVIAKALEAVGADSKIERERDFYKKRATELETRLRKRGAVGED